MKHWDTASIKLFVKNHSRASRCSQTLPATYTAASCYRCQYATPLLNYRNRQRLPLTQLFHTFSVDAASSIPTTTSGGRLLLIRFYFFTGCPLSIARKESTLTIVHQFVENESIQPFGYPSIAILDDATAFMAT